MAEGLAAVYVGYVYLHRREVHGLQCIEYGNACVRVGGGVYNYSVRRAVGGLNLVHYRALVIGLKNLGLYARLAAYALYVFN